MRTTKIKRNLVGLAELRESFGLNQKLMAMYLKININTLKAVETGRRSLPTHALITIANLEMQLACKNENTDHNTMHAVEHNNAGAFNEKYLLVKVRENKCRADQKLLANEFDVMKCNYQKWRARMQVIETMIAENNGVDMELQEWQKQKNIVAIMLGKCGLPLQLLVQNRLQIVESEINFYDKLELQMAAELPGFLSD